MWPLELLILKARVEENARSKMLEPNCISQLEAAMTNKQSESITEYSQSSLSTELEQRTQDGMVLAAGEFSLQHQDNLLLLLSFMTVMSLNADNNKAVIS